MMFSYLYYYYERSVGMKKLIRNASLLVWKFFLFLAWGRTLLR